MLAGLYWLYLWPAATTGDARTTVALVRRGAADLGRHATGSSPATRCTRCTAPPRSPRRPTAAAVPRTSRTGPPSTSATRCASRWCIGVPIGLAFAWLYTRRRARRCRSPSCVAMTAVFAIGPLFGLPLIRRYVETPAVLLTLFYGLAVAGWLLLPRGSARARAGWCVGAVRRRCCRSRTCRGTSASSRASSAASTSTATLYADLQRVGEAPAVRAAFARCAPLTAPTTAPIPFVRFWLDGAPGSVGTVEGGASPMGQAAAAAAPQPRDAPLTAQHVPRSCSRRRATRRSTAKLWRVFAAPGCQPLRCALGRPIPRPRTRWAVRGSGRHPLIGRGRLCRSPGGAQPAAACGRDVA